MLLLLRNPPSSLVRSLQSLTFRRSCVLLCFALLFFVKVLREEDDRAARASDLSGDTARAAALLAERNRPIDARLLDLDTQHLLLKWINFQVKSAGGARRAPDFGASFADGELYSHLLRAMVAPRLEAEPVVIPQRTFLD